MYTVNSDHCHMDHSEDRITESYQYARSETNSERMDYDDDRYTSEVAWPY